MSARFLGVAIFAIVLSLTVTISFLIMSPVLDATVDNLNTTVVALNSTTTQQSFNRIMEMNIVTIGGMLILILAGYLAWVYLTATRKEVVTGMF
jgi:hypothetical protein